MITIREIAADLLQHTAIESACMLKVKEHPKLNRPAWDVWVKLLDSNHQPEKRGRHLFSVIGMPANLDDAGEPLPDFNHNLVR